MPYFNPTIRITGGEDEPDLLAGGVLNGLTRPFYHPLSHKLVPSFLMALVTMGLLPLALMVRWLRDFIAQQEQQFWHLAEWLRLQSGDPDAQELEQAAQRLHHHAGLALLTRLFMLAAVVAAAMHFSTRPFDLRSLYRFAYQMPASTEAIVYALALSAAGVCHWAHLAWHQQNVERYVRLFSHIAARNGLAEVPLPATELGLRPMWIIAGIILASGGALWGIPVMLAAGAHRRYIKGASVQTRAILAERLRALLRQRRPAMRLPQPITVIRTCVRPNCRAPLPTPASYCPRCGTRVVRKMEVA